MSAGEILMNVNLIFSGSVECPKGGLKLFSEGVETPWDQCIRSTNVFEH